MGQYTEMTVSELKALAKERDIKLPVGAVKQTIIDLLEAADQPQAPEKPRTYKVASIISDDDDEDDSTYYSRPTPSAPAPKAKENGASTLANISSKAPAFNLEGSRTWHNPRAYQAQSSYSGKSAWASSQRSGYIAQEKAAMEASRQGQSLPQDGGYVSGKNMSFSRYDRPVQEENRPVRDPDLSLNDSSGATVAELLAAGECGDGSGILEIHPDGFGFLRNGSGKNSRSDVYVSNAQIRRFSLRTGDYVEGKTRPGKDGERYSALLYITKINGQDPEEIAQRLTFEDLTPEYSAERITLSDPDSFDPLNTVIDLLCPLGFGQRSLIYLPEDDPGDIASVIGQAAKAGKPHAVVSLIHVGTRPEDVPEIKALSGLDTVCLPFDMLPDQVLRGVDIALERAKREAERQGDAVLIIDSLDRLAEACLLQDRIPCGGDGTGAPALGRLNRFFGSARKLREGGTLTVIGLMRRPVDPDIIERGLKRCATGEIHLKRQDNARMPLGIDPAECRTERKQQLLTAEDRLLSEKILQKLEGSKDPQKDLTRMMTASGDFNKVLMTIMGM